MKTKKASKTNQKSRIIFFAIALTYNLLLGIYLKDFFVLSPMPVTLYLLSALPTLHEYASSSLSPLPHSVE